MTFSDYYCRKIPEYYPSMYLDGFTPNEILYACRQTMLREAQEREAAQKIGEIKITTEMRIKK